MAKSRLTVNNCERKHLKQLKENVTRQPYDYALTTRKAFFSQLHFRSTMWIRQRTNLPVTQHYAARFNVQCVCDIKVH
jgi:hypothetical protein